MEPRTSNGYQKDVLAHYLKHKGGTMSGYLTKPTPRQIREACIALLEERNSPKDKEILKRFFGFREGENWLKGIQNSDTAKFKPVVNFLKKKTHNPNLENVELISWLIDFQPRPLKPYLAKQGSISSDESVVKNQEIGEPKKELPQNHSGARGNATKGIPSGTKKNGIDWNSILVGIGILVVLSFSLQKIVSKKENPMAIPNQCMTWADSLYVKVSCDTSPYSEYGTKVEPLDPIRFKNMRRLNHVFVGLDFFAPDGSPLVWYHKNKAGDMEYFTAPGLHPVNGETLKKITPYIIQKYVPLYAN